MCWGAARAALLVDRALWQHEEPQLCPRICPLCVSRALLHCPQLSLCGDQHFQPPELPRGASLGDPSVNWVWVKHFIVGVGCSQQEPLDGWWLQRSMSRMTRVSPRSLLGFGVLPTAPCAPSLCYFWYFCSPCGPALGMLIDPGGCRIITPHVPSPPSLGAALLHPQCSLNRSLSASCRATAKEVWEC